MYGRLIVCGLLAMCVVAGEATAADAATYKGRTAQGRAIKIASKGRKIKMLRFKAELKCRNGTLLVDDESGFLWTPLRGKGRFKDRQYGSTDTVWFRGRRTKKAITGRLRVTDKLGNGTRCNSGWVKFTAKRR